jgi:hypothetical protein
MRRKVDQLKETEAALVAVVGTLSDAQSGIFYVTTFRKAHASV